MPEYWVASAATAISVGACIAAVALVYAAALLGH